MTYNCTFTGFLLTNNFFLTDISDINLNLSGFKSASTGFHWLSVTSNNFHWLPTASTGFHQVPTASIGFHWLPLASTGFHRFPPASTNFYPKSIYLISVLWYQTIFTSLYIVKRSIKLAEPINLNKLACQKLYILANVK